PAFSLHRSPYTRTLPPFPTRRSSDLTLNQGLGMQARPALQIVAPDEVHITTRVNQISRTACPQVDRFVFSLSVDAEVTFLIRGRSEEHTSELQSRFDLVCRLLLEKKN